MWKDALVAALNPPRKGRRFGVVDVAGGTGDIAFRIAERSHGHADGRSSPTSTRRCSPSGASGPRSAASPTWNFARRTRSACRSPDASFDAYTIAFGIRNVPSLETALAEALRVLKHGGRFLCLEFSEVDVPMLDRLYDAYSFNAIPAIGRAVTGDEDAYRYLVELIRTFPNQERFADLIRTAGFDRVTYRNFSGGIAALHSAWKL